VNAWLVRAGASLVLVVTALTAVQQLVAASLLRESSLWREAEPRYALELAIRAGDTGPANPDALAAAAALYDRRALDGDSAAAALAVDAWRKLTGVRTGDGAAWAGFAWAKARAGVVDAEFDLAVRQASRLHPWEAPSQYRLLAAGLPRWLQLSGASRRELLDVARRALTHPSLGQQARTARLLEHHGFLGTVCRQLEYFSSSCPKV